MSPAVHMVKNVNIGLMGHVDCGKTSIAKCLSSIGGTACFDKSPQSQSRGITLDLGFSTYKHKDHQVTIVDCPGHASLIRTVLCGAQIIDLIVLVIDGTKGIQAQTAECLIIAEIMTEKLVFVINKIDLWPEEERSNKFESIKIKLRTAMKDGKFAKMPIVPFSASLNLGIDELKTEIDALITAENPIVRNVKDDFVFAVDHCFPLKGQGTILTGTVLQGQISINESIEIPDLKISRKIKSIQSFRENVKSISSGDRAGICLQSFQSDLIERTLISSKPLITKTFLLLEAKRVKHFKGELRSKSKIHISVLNESVLCKQILIVNPTPFGYEYLETVKEDEDKFHVIIELEKPINILPDAIVIGSKLDSHLSLQKCRIAFHGRWKETDFDENSFEIYKLKHKYSLIDRIVSENRLIGKGIVSESELNANENFKGSKESIAKYIGMKVSFHQKGNDEFCSVGVIDSLFGSSGKFNVSINSSFLCSHDLYYMKLSFGKVINNGKNNEKLLEIK